MKRIQIKLLSNAKKEGGAPLSKTGHRNHSISSPLTHVNLDIPARNSILCLVVRISLGIGAVPDLDIEVIGVRTRLAVVLRLHSEGVQAIAIDRACTLELLDGIVDIYMPDIKYEGTESAKLYSDAPDYFEVCKQAVREMHRQVGDLVIDRTIGWHGLLIRHLVLPNNVADSLHVLEFIAGEISRESYVSIMPQYRSAYRALEFEDIDRAVYIEEYYNVLDMARGLGLHRGFPNE